MIQNSCKKLTNWKLTLTIFSKTRLFCQMPLTLSEIIRISVDNLSTVVTDLFKKVTIKPIGLQIANFC